MRNTADLKAGITMGSTLPTKTPAMQIDGGKIFRQSTDAAKGGKDKGYPLQDIKKAPVAASLSRGAEFHRIANARSIASAPKVTMPSPVAPKINVTYKSMNTGPMFGGGMRGGMMPSGGNPFGRMD
jgi:hypothetical protein